MKPLRRVGLAAVVISFSGPWEAFCQQSPALSPAYALRAVRVDDGAILLDGRLAEEAWRLAPAANSFTQRDPDDGAPATEDTEVRVVYSSSAIYVAVRAHDSQPDQIRSVLGRRDVNTGSDRIAVLFDSYGDRRTSFRFVVTPSGSISDVVHLNDTDVADASWDPVWEVATSMDEGGWTAEFRIPFSQLRFDARNTAWGFQVHRRIERKAEDTWWAPYSRNTSGFASRFGTLEGLEGLPSPMRLEVRPTAVASGQYRPEGSGSLYAPSRQHSASAGLDVKLGISSDFTLDFTANPDFGQVEADPAEVNLSAFETFLPERRPFFVEGVGLLPTGRMFYTRRIGRAPQGFAEAPAGGNVETPEAATILAAAKLTGKSGGFGLGVMSTLTGEEHATLRDPSGAVVGFAPVEPRTHYFAGRASRDLRGGTHAIGLSATAVNRWLNDDLDHLRAAAYVGSLDGAHSWRGNEYALSWSLGVSHIRGSADAMRSAQLSSIRYYQRPDASHVDADPERTTLSGYVLGLDLGKQAGAIRYYLGFSRTSPGFESNDMGFHGRVDQDAFYGGGAYVRNRPLGVLRTFRIGPDFSRLRTTAGEVEETWLRPILFNATFTNNWTLGLNPVAFRWDRWSPTALRGGPGLVNDIWRNSFITLSTDARQRVQLVLNANVGGVLGQPAPFGGVTTALNFRPNEVTTGSLGITYNARRDPQEWVGRRVVADSTHYVLGTIRQRTLGVTTRLDWTLTPRLSLQFYAQPFVSAGRYSDFAEVASPGADLLSQRLRPYGDRLSCVGGTCAVDLDGSGAADFSFPQPDFNSRQLRSTAILRWEYLPGSVLYVGWQHGRSARLADGTFRATRDLTDLFSLESQNVLLIKANYWLSF